MRWVLALLAVVGACDVSGADPGPPASAAPATSSSTPSASASVDAGPAHVASDVLRRCAEAKGDIASIQGVVLRLNALVPAADGPCLIATLPRPLAVVATIGVTSAQPAAGKTSPRLFFLLPKVVISAVPDGDGSKVLETGEWVTPTRTLKGEVGLPVTAPLAADAPFARVLQGPDRTLCATCHREEEPHAAIPKAFVSTAFKPERGTEVTVAELRSLHDACTDPSTRCAMLHALFDFGEVKQGAFAEEVETFSLQ